MRRNAHALDLLRPEQTLEYHVAHLGYKQELTPEDMDEIIKNAELVIEAAKIAKRKLQEQNK